MNYFEEYPGLVLVAALVAAVLGFTVAVYFGAQS